MPVTTNAGILDEEVSATCLAVGLPHRRDVAELCGQASFIADLLQGIQDRLVGILRAASVLPAGVDVITVRVDDVQMARADKGAEEAGRCAGLTFLHPAGGRAAAAEGSALLGTGRTTTSTQICVAPPAMSY